MSANMFYHFNRLLEMIDATYEATPARSAVKCEIIRAAADLEIHGTRKPETDFSNEEPIKSIASIDWFNVTGRGQIALVNYQEAADLEIEVGETILIDGHKYEVRDIEQQGQHPISLVVRTLEEEASP